MLRVAPISSAYRPLDPIRPAGFEAVQKSIRVAKANDNLRLQITETVPQANGFKGQFVDLLS